MYTYEEIEQRNIKPSNLVDQNKYNINGVYFAYPNIEEFPKSVMGKLLLTDQLFSCINKDFFGTYPYLFMSCLWLLLCYTGDLSG